MKMNLIPVKLLMALSLLSSQLKAETNTSNSSQVLRVPVSNYAMDYLPDLRIQFTSPASFPFLLGTEQYYGTAFEFTFSSGDKSFTETLATLKNPINYSSENDRIIYPATTQWSIRLWDLYSVAIRNGVSPKNLKIRFKIIKNSGNTKSSYSSGEFEFPTSLEELSLNPNAQKLSNLQKNNPNSSPDISYSLSIVGYKSKLFDDLWSWNQLLPANSLLSSRFLNLLAQSKTNGQRKSANIGDLLDVFYTYAQDQTTASNYKWPRDEELKGTSQSSHDLVLHIQQSLASGQEVKTYWSTIAEHMTNVVDNIQMDLSSQESTIESLMAAHYPAGTIVQINSTTDITNNIENNVTATSVASGNNGLNLGDSAIEAYYSRKLRLEKAAAFAEQSSTIWRGLKEALAEQLR